MTYFLTAIDEHFSPGRCQVVSMAIHEQKLYVGTSWGCLIITEAETMRPITVFRPYSDEVQNIVVIKDLTKWPRIFKRTPKK